MEGLIACYSKAFVSVTTCCYPKRKWNYNIFTFSLTIFYRSRCKILHANNKKGYIWSMMHWKCMYAWRINYMWRSTYKIKMKSPHRTQILIKPCLSDRVRVWPNFTTSWSCVVNKRKQNYVNLDWYGGEVIRVHVAKGRLDQYKEYVRWVWRSWRIMGLIRPQSSRTQAKRLDCQIKRKSTGWGWRAGGDIFPKTTVAVTREVDGDVSPGQLWWLHMLNVLESCAT